MSKYTPPTVTVTTFTQTPMTPLVRKWWLVGLFGLALVVIGILLLARLSDAKTLLVWLVAIALVVAGANEIGQAERLTRRWPSYLLGVIWIVTGILAVAWPDITLWALAVVTGLGLLLGGISEVMFTLTYRREISYWGVWLVDGLISVTVGIFALVWPRATVVVLAILLGLRILLGGIVTLVFAGGMYRLNKTLQTVRT